MFNMEKIVEIFKNLIPDFKGDRIMAGAFFMFFIIIFSLSYLFFKYILHCAFSNPFLNTMWAICTFCLAMALICFLSAYKDYLIVKNKEKKEREYFYNVLNRAGGNVRKFFEDLIRADKDIFEINSKNTLVLEYLNLRNLDIYQECRLSNNRIAIIKRKYFNLLKEYFHLS